MTDTAARIADLESFIAMLQGDADRARARLTDLVLRGMPSDDLLAAARALKDFDDALDLAIDNLRDLTA